MKFKELPADIDLALTTRIKDYETALDEILKTGSLVTAKEIAAEALDVDVDDYLVDEFDEESFNNEEDTLYLNDESSY